jgi:hypothetical protein
MTGQYTSPDAAAHTPGVHKGEEESGRGHSRGLVIPRARTSRDATGINPDKRAPIDPRMPNLPPA